MTTPARGRVRLDGVPRRERLRVWMLRHTPASLLWHPFEWFMAGLCSVSGFAFLLQPAEEASLEALLPGPFLKAWGVALLVGALALARGLSSIRSVSADRYVVTRVPAYKLGLRLLGVAVSIYIAALVLYTGPAGIRAAVIPTAFVAMCAVRLLALGGRR